jgi:hypothetical protein
MNETTPNYLAQHPSHNLPPSGEPEQNMSIGQYIATRVSSLKPPMTRLENPITLLGSLNRHHWNAFGIAFCGKFSIRTFVTLTNGDASLGLGQFRLRASSCRSLCFCCEP